MRKPGALQRDCKVRLGFCGGLRKGGWWGRGNPERPIFDLTVKDAERGVGVSTLDVLVVTMRPVLGPGIWLSRPGPAKDS